MKHAFYQKLAQDINLQENVTISVQLDSFRMKQQKNANYRAHLGIHNLSNCLENMNFYR